MSKSLTAIVDGTIVSGRYLHESTRTVEIELTMDDLPRLRFSWVVPERQSRQGRCVVTSTPTKPGRQLATIYTIARHLVHHEEQIIASYRALEVALAQTLADGTLPDDLFMALKTALRGLVANGGATEVDHHQDVVQLRVGHSSFHEREDALRSHWFRSLFRAPVDRELQGQIVAYIKQRRAELVT